MAKRKRATVEELERENRRIRRHGIGGNVTKVLIAMLQWGALVWIAFQARDVAVAWAGKTTLASISITGSAAASVEVAAEQLCGTVKSLQELAVFVAAFSTLTTISAVMYGRRQAQLRRDVIQRLSPFEQMFEKQIDARRTTSGIQRTGETRREDE